MLHPGSHKMDMISKLPLGVIETILCFLPIQEAARTSILSREWRYHWIKIPKLAFIERTFQVSTDENELSVLEQTYGTLSKRKEMAKRCKLFYAIYQVILMHQDPIHDFTLSMEIDGSCVEIDHIILYLSKKNSVKILKLNLYGGPYWYRLPSSFFSLHQLTDLYLNGCLLDHQPSSTVFGSLTTLNLQEIQIRDKALLRLLSSCPLLKRLTIISDIDGGYREGPSIADLMDCLPNVEYLSVFFFIFMCFLPLPKGIPTKLVHLKYLCMELVWFSHKYAVPFLVLLLKSAPNLEKLKLELSAEALFDESETAFVKLEDYSDIMLEHLEELEIIDFSNEENELEVVKLIFGKSPALKNVRILLWDEFDEDGKLEISEILLSFRCASPVVEIIIT